MSSSHSFKKLTASLCESTTNDKVLEMRTNLRRAKADIRTIYPYVKCENVSLMSYALANQSQRVIDFLNKKAKPELTKG